MRILITGKSGFVGGHLADALAAWRPVELHGFGRGAGQIANPLPNSVAIQTHSADLLNRDQVSRLLAGIQPNWIAHLAGYAHAGRSFQEPDAAWTGNLEATRSLYEAIRMWGGSPRILFVSTGLVYGDAEAGADACTESAPLRPASPYAASKAAADLASFQLSRTPGLDIVRVRPHNHIGPRQAPDYAIARFASQIAAIELGRQPPILETGDLDARRDLTDVRDMVRAHIRLLEVGVKGEAYNASSGREVRIGDALELLLKQARVPIQVKRRIDDRPAEPRICRLDSTKLARETGWRPLIPFEQTLRDTLEYWRQRETQ